MDAANAVPVVGTPLAYGLGFAVLVFSGLVEAWARPLVTVAHEGGHMIMAIVTLRGHKGWKLEEGGNAATTLGDGSWGVGDYLVRFAGYALPPLAGLGGALLVRDGNIVGTLWIALLFAGGASVRAGAATALAWWLLVGGLIDTLHLSRANGTDAYWLARRTLVPRIVWQGLWIAIAVVCLWKGGRALLAV